MEGLRGSGTMNGLSFHYSRLWHTLGWLMVAAVIVLSVAPEVPSVVDVPGSDKVDHVVAYMSLMFWFCQLHGERRRWLWLGVGLFGLGVCLELVQGLLAFRTASLTDALANGCGILMGWWVVRTRLGHLLPYLDGRLLWLMNRSRH